MGVPDWNEARPQVPQVLGGADPGAAQAGAAQERAPALDLIEPRAMGRQPVRGDLRTLGRAPVQDRLSLMKAGVVHNQMPATGGVAGAQGAQEVAKLQIGMALVARGKDLAGPDLKSKEIDGAMAEIYSNSWRSTKPGRRGKVGCNRSKAWRAMALS